MPDRHYESIVVELDARVATVTLNVPDRRNPLSPQMVNELHWALQDAAEDPRVRVLVLTGAGGSFSAGADLGQLTQPEGESELPVLGDYAELLQRFPVLGKPTIARVEGPALGGGLGLVASCDLVIAAENVQLGTPEIHLGLWPMQIMALLQRQIPQRKLLEMMLLGEKLDARAALACGLVTRVVATERLDEEVRAVASQLAAGPSEAMRRGLVAFRAQSEQTLAEALPYLREQLEELLSTDDAREGLLSFLEKRTPAWRD